MTKPSFTAAALVAVCCGTAQAAPPTFTTLFHFTGASHGRGPNSIAYVGNMIYGVTVGGGLGNDGVLYQFNPSTGSETVLTKFTGNNVNGYYPISMSAGVSKVYVATLEGGVGGQVGGGTIYKYNTKSGAQRKLFDFAQIDASCFANPVQEVNGKLYGTCPQGNADVGSLFMVDPHTGAGAVLFTFQNGPEGGYPAGPVAYDNGVLYGAVQSVSGDNLGGLFSFDLITGKETIIARFQQSAQGSLPVGVADCGGTLYGFNDAGGAQSQGTAFAYTIATGTASTLYTFQGGTDSQPMFAPAPVCDGKTLYATAENGGAHGYGTVFSIDTSTGKETILHDFTGANGAYPIAGVIQRQKTLYGTTLFGPTKGGLALAGTLFKLEP